MTWTWDGKHHTVTSLTRTAADVLERAEIPDGTVTVSCGHLFDGRLHLEVRVRNTPTLTELACDRLVGMIGVRLAQAVNVDMPFERHDYVSGRTVLTRSFVGPDLSVAVVGQVPVPAPAGVR